MKEQYIKKKPLIDWVRKEFERALNDSDLKVMQYCNAFLQQIVVSEVKEIEK